MEFLFSNKSLVTYQKNFFLGVLLGLSAMILKAEINRYIKQQPSLNPKSFGAGYGSSTD
jgi:hypothetical protein